MKLIYLVLLFDALVAYMVYRAIKYYRDEKTRY